MYEYLQRSDFILLLDGLGLTSRFQIPEDGPGQVLNNFWQAGQGRALIFKRVRTLDSTTL